MFVKFLTFEPTSNDRVFVGKTNVYYSDRKVLEKSSYKLTRYEIKSNQLEFWIHHKTFKLKGDLRIDFENSTAEWENGKIYKSNEKKPCQASFYAKQCSQPFMTYLPLRQASLHAKKCSQPDMPHDVVSHLLHNRSPRFPKLFLSQCKMLNDRKHFFDL